MLGIWAITMILSYRIAVSTCLPEQPPGTVADESEEVDSQTCVRYDVIISSSITVAEAFIDISFKFNNTKFKNTLVDANYAASSISTEDEEPNHALRHDATKVVARAPGSA